MANKIKVLKEYEDGLIIQWNNSIWVIRSDGDQPSLWPVALLSKDKYGHTAIVIPKGTDVANANAIMALLIGIPDLF
jgi:hypothetical protein